MKCLNGFCVFVLVIHFYSGEALKCYMCSAEQNKECEDGNMLNKFKVDCNDEYIKQGHKLVSEMVSPFPGVSVDPKPMFDGIKQMSPMGCLTYHFTGAGKKYTMRSCGFTVKSGGQCDFTKKYLELSNQISDYDCTICDTDFCNSSTHMSPAVFTVFITAALVLYHKQ